MEIAGKEKFILNLGVTEKGNFQKWNLEYTKTEKKDLKKMADIKKNLSGWEILNKTMYSHMKNCRNNWKVVWTIEKLYETFEELYEH